MLVEMFEKDSYWCFKDSTGVTWQTALGIDALSPLEVKVENKNKLKQVLKLKAAEFTADEILELIKEI